MQTAETKREYARRSLLLMLVTLVRLSIRLNDDAVAQKAGGYGHVILLFMHGMLHW